METFKGVNLLGNKYKVKVQSSCSKISLSQICMCVTVNDWSLQKAFVFPDLI